MSEETLLIDGIGEEIRLALLQNDALVEVAIERKSRKGFVGNIYKGKVTRVLPGLQSAFIDIGLEKSVFLHVADCLRAKTSEGTYQPIETILHAGDAIICQVYKDPIGTKGARVTTAISIAGRNLVFLPLEAHIGISQKIESEALRQAILATLRGLVPEDAPFGYIARTSSENATEDDFRRDIDYLNRVWEGIEAKNATVPPATLLYEELDLTQKALRDYFSEKTKAIIVEGAELSQNLKNFAKDYLPSALEKIETYKGFGLFEDLGVNARIDAALAPRVDLKCGGYLVIEQTEAMVTIDVNTGAFVGRSDFEDTVFRTNLEAARAIGRELRLRSLGGIIVIDFIDMNDEKREAAVLAQLKEALSEDRVKTAVMNFSPLGLVEMTRKRAGDSLTEILTQKAQYQRQKTPQTVAYEILRRLRRFHATHPTVSDFTVTVTAAVASRLKEEGLLENIEAELNANVHIVESSCVRDDAFDIQLK